MKALVKEIETTVLENALQIQKLSDAEFEFKRAPNKWSKKEILGHLIDSAQNNINRFVRAQYEDTPRIIYNQDHWVNLQHYQTYDREDLLQLWVLMNKHLCRILDLMEPKNYGRTCDVSQPDQAVHTIEFLAKDYLVHLNHHLKQVNA